MVAFIRGNGDDVEVVSNRRKVLDVARQQLDSEFCPDWLDCLDLRLAGRSFGYIAGRKSCSKSTAWDRVQKMQKRLKEICERSAPAAGKKVSPGP